MPTNNSADYSPSENLIQRGGTNGALVNVPAGTADQVLTTGTPPAFKNPSTKFLWFKDAIDYPDQSYIFYNDSERSNSITFYRNNSGATIAAGPFDAAQWERIGSYDSSPWTDNPTNTGCLSGGILTLGPASNQITVSAGEGLIVSGSLASRTATLIKWPNTILDLLNLATDFGYYFAVDNTGTILKFVKDNTDLSALSRSFIIIGGCTNDVSIPANVGAVINASVPSNDTSNTLSEFLLLFIKPQFVSGGFIQPIAGGLTINRTSGIIYYYGVNYANSPTSANTISLNAQDPLLFTRMLQNNNINGTNTLDPGNYDNGGVLTSLAANKVTIQRVFYDFYNKLSYVVYGQQFYNNLDQARAAIPNSDSVYTMPPFLKGSVIFCAYVLLDSTCTDVSNTAKSYIQQANGMTLQGGATVVNSLSGLLDVGISAQKNGQALTWNGSLWVNRDVTELSTWITQVNHGFVVGDVVTATPVSTFAKALATAQSTLGVGVIREVDGPDNFRVQFAGPLTITAHGYPLGTTLYLSKNVAGALTTTVYNDGVTYSQRIALVLGPNTLLMEIGEGKIISATTISWSEKNTNFAAGVNLGYFVIGNAIATLPATPVDGDTIYFIVDGPFLLTLQAAAGQTIKIGAATSAAAGIAKNTLNGDAITIVYRKSVTRWECLNFIGNWAVTA